MYALGYFYPLYGSGNTLYNEFASYVASQGGTMASPPNTTRVLNSLGNIGATASLICTCDAGKESNLYYLTP